ncbi:hypothetical protein ACLOJK_029313 [Asimina triloba]
MNVVFDKKLSIMDHDSKGVTWQCPETSIDGAYAPKKTAIFLVELIIEQLPCKPPPASETGGRGNAYESCVTMKYV